MTLGWIASPAPGMFVADSDGTVIAFPSPEMAKEKAGDGGKVLPVAKLAQRRRRNTQPKLEGP